MKNTKYNFSRTITKYLFLTLTILFLVSFVNAQHQAKIISQKANLRGTPNQKGLIITEVGTDEVVSVVKQSGPWFLVQTNKYVGWIHGNTIELSNDSSNSKIITDKVLNEDTQDTAVVNEMLPTVVESTPSQTDTVNTSRDNLNYNGPVRVRGYYRRDGTYVRSHTRSRPRSH